MRGEFVDVGGTRLYYYASGTRGGGDPVVFLHGFPGSSLCWRFLAPLMPAGRRLVIVDLMGCGRSDGASHGAHTIATHAGLVRRLMDDLVLSRAALVGHGIGGTIATAIALANPERVSALGLVAAIAFDVRPRSLGRLARFVSPAASAVGAPLLSGFLHGSALRGYVDKEDGHHSLDQSLNGYRKKRGVDGGVDSIVAHLRLDHDPAIREMGSRLGSITAPTSVIWGSEDPFLPVSLGERIAKAIPGATLDVIQGGRHFLPEDAPEKCAEVLTRLLSRS